MKAKILVVAIFASMFFLTGCTVGRYVTNVSSMAQEN
jgi:hypothetical protein